MRKSWHVIDYYESKKMDVESKTLSQALSSSISSEVLKASADIVEIGLDAIIDDGVLRDIPIISTVISVFKVGSNIRDLHYLKKLGVFINSFNQGMINENQRQEYRDKICNNEQSKELEYILVILDRYINQKKASMLAKCFLAYLDSDINWDGFTKFAETIDRFLPGDYQLLVDGEKSGISYKNINDGLLRLVSQGLMVSKSTAPESNQKGTIVIPSVDVLGYTRTQFGTLFVSIMDKYGYSDLENNKSRNTL